jgi:hypothetical protein
MRLPPFDRYVRGLQLTGILLVGMIVGAAIYNSIYIARFEALIVLKSDLEARLEQYEQDIKLLNQYKNQHTVIKSIKPRIEQEAGLQTARPKLDQVTETELVKKIKADLSSFLGKSIYEIDSDATLVRKLMSRMVYSDVYGKEYTIEVKTMLIADNVLHVWVTVREYAKPPS